MRIIDVASADSFYTNTTAENTPTIIVNAATPSRVGLHEVTVSAETPILLIPATFMLLLTGTAFVWRRQTPAG